MKKLLTILLAGSMIFSLAACSSESSTESSEESSTSSQESSQSESLEEESSEEELKELAELNPTYSSLFAIEDLGDGIKKVTDYDGQEIILVPKELAEVPAEYSDDIVIRTPVENAVFLSSTFVASFGNIESDNVFDSIAAVSNDVDGYANIPAIADRLASGDIADIGGNYTDPDYETIISLNPDVVFVTSGTYADTTSMEKFDELGITYVGIAEYVETDYVARMEWCRMFLTFFDEDETAAQIMESAEENIANAQALVEGSEQPKVLFASSYSGTVYVTSPDSWVGNMIGDAGGDYLLADEYEVGLSYSLEEFILKAEEADIIVWTGTPGYGATKSVVFEEIPLLADVPAVLNDKLYSYSDLFWSCVDETDIMFEDLVAVFYEEDFADRELKYFQKMAE
ncbi:MAG: ABC transporter substrate-binding protein [Clostridia bacterium]